MLHCCDSIQSPKLAEAITIRRALMVAWENGFKDIILVSDCLSMINKVLSMNRERSSVGSVVTDIKILALEFAACSFKHSSRKSNVVAHFLAHRSERAICNLSFVVAPECIREVLCNDVP